MPHYAAALPRHRCGCPAPCPSPFFPRIPLPHLIPLILNSSAIAPAAEAFQLPPMVGKSGSGLAKEQSQE